MTTDNTKYNPDVIDPPIQIVKQPNISLKEPDIVEINDIRSPCDFRGVSFSNFKKSEVKKKMIDSILAKKY